MKWERTCLPEPPGWVLRFETTSISVWDTGTGVWRAMVTDTSASSTGFIVVTGQSESVKPHDSLSKLEATSSGRVSPRLHGVIRQALDTFPG